MAQYNYRAHGGLTQGYTTHVRNNVYSLVKQAAEGVGWNSLGAAPTGFTPTTVDGKVKNIHTKTGIEFKAGFLMKDITGAAQKWEGHAVAGSFRLDLQSINGGWANWAVQTNGQNSVTVATCLMRVDQGFSQNELATGLIQSAERNQICEITQ